MTEPIIYKVASKTLWDEARAAGRFEGSAVDVADGYIHFSTAAQVAETVRRHYAGQADLLLIAVRTASLEPALRWEPSRGGDLFPHLYAPLPLDAVAWERPLPLGADGRHVFPPLGADG